MKEKKARELIEACFGECRDSVLVGDLTTWVDGLEGGPHHNDFVHFFRMVPRHTRCVALPHKRTAYDFNSKLYGEANL